MTQIPPVQAGGAPQRRQQLSQPPRELDIRGAEPVPAMCVHIPIAVHQPLHQGCALLHRSRVHPGTCRPRCWPSSRQPAARRRPRTDQAAAPPGDVIAEPVELLHHPFAVLRGTVDPARSARRPRRRGGSRAPRGRSAARASGIGKPARRWEWRGSARRRRTGSRRVRPSSGSPGRQLDPSASAPIADPALRGSIRPRRARCDRRRPR